MYAVDPTSGQRVNGNVSLNPMDVPVYVNDIKLVDTSTIASESDLTAIGIAVTGSGTYGIYGRPWTFLSDSNHYFATGPWQSAGTEGWVQIKFDTPILLSWMQLLGGAITDIKFEYSTTDNEGDLIPIPGEYGSYTSWSKSDRGRIHCVGRPVKESSIVTLIWSV